MHAGFSSTQRKHAEDDEASCRPSRYPQAQRRRSDFGIEAEHPPTPRTDRPFPRAKYGAGGATAPALRQYHAHPRVRRALNPIERLSAN